LPANTRRLLKVTHEGMDVFTVGLITAEALFVFVASTTLFDLFHYFLHRWRTSKIRFLRVLSSMHWAHHRFLRRTMKIDRNYREANIWSHVIPEYLTSIAGTLVFLLIFSWSPIAIVAVFRTIMLIFILKAKGVDANHFPMYRVGGKQSTFWVNRNYHAMHHVYPNQFFSSFGNVFDLIFGTACQIRGRKFLITGATGAFGRAMKGKLLASGGVVDTVKWGVEFVPGDYEKINDKLRWADVLVVSHGVRNGDCWAGNFRTFVDVIDRFISLKQDKLLPPEVWALGSEAELHGDFGLKNFREYVASKRAFAARARHYYSSDKVLYRHIVPCAFTSGLGKGFISANTAAAIALFFIKRAFKYIPVTVTTLAIWNYFRFCRLSSMAGDNSELGEAEAR